MSLPLPFSRTSSFISSQQQPQQYHSLAAASATTTTTTLQMSMEDAPEPTTFREAEVLGLRYMQEDRFEQALEGERMKLGMVKV